MYPDLSVVFSDESVWKGNLYHFKDLPEKHVCLLKISFPGHYFVVANADIYGALYGDDYIELASQAPYNERTNYERVYEDGRQESRKGPNTDSLEKYHRRYGLYQTDESYLKCREMIPWL